MKRPSPGPKNKPKHTPARARQSARKLCNPVCQHRIGPFEFSCGFDDRQALLVEESLDERERKG
jgi:hypothetical protein